MTKNYACLAMYPFDELVGAYEGLWRVVGPDLPWMPSALHWPDDVHATWLDPACQLSQTCGWPLATALRDQVRVVGSFVYDVPEADGYCYRSVLLARRNVSFDNEMKVRFAANSRDSLSGWISLCAALGIQPNELEKRTTFTGGHVASLRALHAGVADVASIDSVTLHHVRQYTPGLVADLHQIGVGPLVPSLPIVVASTASDAQVRQVRGALARAVTDPSIHDDLYRLRIRGFVPLGPADFEALLDLVIA